MNDDFKPRYPTDSEIKVQWTPFHIVAIAAVTLVVWVWFFSRHDLHEPGVLNKFFSVLGLNIDTIGVVVASLKPPYFGSFHDGGAVEMKRQKAERASFENGMFIVAIGLFLQALGVLL